MYLTAPQVEEVLLLPPVWSFVCVCPSLDNGDIEKDVQIESIFIKSQVLVHEVPGNICKHVFVSSLFGG